jgi:uncharacterized protein (TIGR02300 family)
MTNPGLGQKRRCLECEAAFYDLNRDPITCPKCGAVHQPVARLKSDGRTPPKGRTFPKRQPALAPAGEVEAADGAATIDKDFDSEEDAAEEETEDEAEDGDETAVDSDADAPDTSEPDEKR